LIFGLSSLLTGIVTEQQTIQVIFSEERLQPNEAFNEKDAVALLSLKKIYQEVVNNDTILFSEGVTGKHRFISPFHQFIIQLNNRLYNKRPGNVFLPGNLYNQVHVAYALPRTISLITVSDGELFNHFPTDLHGQVNDEFYIISLRHEGKACQQVESAKRIVISNMDAATFRSVYALGKNHMQPLKDRSVFDFDIPVSGNFRLPLPKNMIAYKELQLQRSFMHGIHKILLFKIIYEEKMTDNPSTLAHIHNCYATWRYKQGKTSNFLLR